MHKNNSVSNILSISKSLVIFRNNAHPSRVRACQGRRATTITIVSALSIIVSALLFILLLLLFILLLLLLVFLHCIGNGLHPVSVTRFPSFRTQTLENLSHYLWTNGFLSNPDPGENLVMENLVMETGCTTISTKLLIPIDYCDCLYCS